VNDTDLGPTEEFLVLLGRGYPRSAPGRISLLQNAAYSGELRIEGRWADAGDEILVWTPTTGDTHLAWSDGLDDLVEHPVDGGRLLSATVSEDGDYAVGVSLR